MFKMLAYRVLLVLMKTVTGADGVRFTFQNTAQRDRFAETFERANPGVSGRRTG